MRDVAFISPDFAVTVPACAPALFSGVNVLFSNDPLNPVYVHSIVPIAFVWFPLAS